MKIVAVVFLSSLTMATFAQTFGVKAGFNLSNVLEKDNDRTYSDDYKMNPGFHAGLTMDVPLISVLSFETGLLFSTKGYRVDKAVVMAGVPLNMKGSVTTCYLDLPLTAKASFDVGDVKIYGAFGPYVGLGLTGKTKMEFNRNGSSFEEERDIDWGNDEIDDDLMRFDVGLTAGTGVEFGPMQVGLSYGFGLINISPYDNNGYRVKNRVLGLSVGYRFGVN